jgi:hypothetical protein
MILFEVAYFLEDFFNIGAFRLKWTIDGFVFTIVVLELLNVNIIL